MLQKTTRLTTDASVSLESWISQELEYDWKNGANSNVVVPNSEVGEMSGNFSR